MDILINKDITYQVSKVVVRMVIIYRRGGELIFCVPFSWLDATGKTILSNTASLTAPQMVAIMGDSVNAFVVMGNALVPQVDAANVVLTFLANDVKCTTGQYVVSGDNKNWVVSDITTQFKNMLSANSVSTGALQTLIANLTQAKLA